MKAYLHKAATSDDKAAQKKSKTAVSLKTISTPAIKTAFDEQCDNKSVDKVQTEAKFGPNALSTAPTSTAHHNKQIALVPPHLADDSCGSVKVTFAGGDVRYSVLSGMWLAATLLMQQG